MGCDIHLFIEVKRKGSDHWFAFGSEFRLDRNYWMFGTLSRGVRCVPENSHEAKGLPSDTSYTVNEIMYKYVSDFEDRGNIKPEKAQEYLDKKYSFGKYNAEGKLTHVSDSDLHSHSWLTFEEYKQALEWYKQSDKNFYGISPDYLAIRESMQVYENSNFDTRVVFAFDN